MFRKDKDAAEEFAFRCKQAGQLASKMRFLAAPWLGLLQTGAWLRNAQAANRAAENLECQLRSIPGVPITTPRQANAVFVALPPGVSQALHDRDWHFYEFIGRGGVRLMCSWDTTDEDINLLIADLRELMGIAQTKRS